MYALLSQDHATSEISQIMVSEDFTKVKKLLTLISKGSDIVEKDDVSCSNSDEVIFMAEF